MDVEAWLNDLGLGQYAKAFAENDVDLEVLPELSDAELATLGVSLGHRKKIQQAIRPLVPGAFPAEVPEELQYASPNSYTPSHLAARIRAARGQMEGERKQVTILFADIKGSLELIEGSDPEQAHAILDVAVRTMMDAVHLYEGTVNKVLGDGIMALFGAPIAHEDHAVRACYAALAMLDAMAGKAAELRHDYGVEAQLRVGLHSGEVVVRSIGNDLAMDYDAIGPTAHLAGRMEQLALPGTVRLSAETARLAEGFFEARSLGPVPVKGLKAPIELFELTGAAEGWSRFQAAVARGLSRFVGRETEMAALGRALERAREGQGQVFATMGEAGLGKSRLYYEFLRTPAVEGWLVLAAGSVSYGKATAYKPVVDLLKGYFGIESRDTPRGVREKVIGKLLTLDEGLGSILAPIQSLLNLRVEDPAWDELDPTQRRQRSIEAVRRLLLRESQEQPLLVMFEDLHWIDGATQVVLDALVDSLPKARMLLLVNYRPEYGHGWAGRSYYAQRRLEPLPPESAETLLGALLGENPALDALERLLIERTEGNPFFLEESVRSLVEADALAGLPGAYRLDREVAALEIPATVQGVLAARIDRLLAEDKQLLQTAAVVGKDLPFALLQAVAEGPEERLNAGLRALQAAEFLYETRLFPEREYTFKHALTHEVAYGSLLSDWRRSLHRKIAEAMERLYADGLAEHWERLAHHCTEAGLTEKAVTYWQLAGQRSSERSSNQEAIAQLRKALDLLAALPHTADRDRRELALQIALGVPLQNVWGAGAEEVGKAYGRARELCTQAGETRELFTVLWGLWRYYRQGWEFRKAREITEELFDLAHKEDDGTLLLQAHHAHWTTKIYLGEFESALESAEGGVGLYNQEKHAGQAFLFAGHDPAVCGLGAAAMALWLLGYPDRAIEKSQAALALACDLDHPASLALALSEYAEILELRGEGELLQAQTEALLPITIEQEFTDKLATGIFMHGWARAAQGFGEAGLDEMEHGVSQRGRWGEIEEPMYVALLVEAYRRQGRIERGLETLAEAFATADTNGMTYWDAELHRLKGDFALARGDGAEAEHCYHHAIALAQGQNAKSLELRAAMRLARLWADRDRREEARERLAPLYAWFTEGFDTADLREAKALMEEVT